MSNRNEIDLRIWMVPPKKWLSYHNFACSFCFPDNTMRCPRTVQIIYVIHFNCVNRRESQNLKEIQPTLMIIIVSHTHTHTHTLVHCVVCNFLIAFAIFPAFRRISLIITYFSSFDVCVCFVLWLSRTSASAQTSTNVQQQQQKI